jgi:SAM-dependent methyltransferase
MKNINDVAKWGREWQKSNTDIASHTITKDRARLLAPSYMEFLRAKTNSNLNNIKHALDIGAGAGYISAAFEECSHIQMTASEWSVEGVDLIHRHNPQLCTRILDIMQFDEKNIYDLIFCRELYPFTRVNSFTDQHQIISRVIDALNPGGVFLLVGSDVSFPHCADYKLLIKLFRKDNRLQLVSEPYLEPVVLRVTKFSFLGNVRYRLANLFGEFVMYLNKRHGWASTRLIAFQKKD